MANLDQFRDLLLVEIAEKRYVVPMQADILIVQRTCMASEQQQDILQLDAQLQPERKDNKLLSELALLIEQDSIRGFWLQRLWLIPARKYHFQSLPICMQYQTNPIKGYYLDQTGRLVAHLDLLLLAQRIQPLIGDNSDAD